MSIKPTERPKVYERPISRAPMVYRAYPDAEMTADWKRVKESIKNIPGLRHWKKTAFTRRFTLWLLVGFSTTIAAAVASTIFSGNSPVSLRTTIVFLFALLFGWLAYNFFTAFVGFVLYVQGEEPYNPSNVLKNVHGPLSTSSNVAVIMPIYNEDVANVFARMETMYEAIQLTAAKHQFTFFLLSDSTNPDVWVDEEIAWKKCCDRLNAHGRIVYRHRRSPIRKKSGNVADFCRRWGSQFDYMITLDSDSLMSAASMVKMAAILDRRPDIGILQTAPLFFHGTTPLSRLQQFISHAYGPIFFRGLHYFQLGDAGYWGHNAITRIAPFMKYGALPETSGKPPFGGTVLSHDTIEAALMRRAGYGVWLGYDIDGSFEQSPATLALELERDQRWCRGNLQHVRYLGMSGASWGHRWIFLSGNVFYASSFLWLVLMLCTTVDSITKALTPQVYFGAGNVLFPQWPKPNAGWGLALISLTICFLFLPKVLGLLTLLVDSKKRRLFGGPIKIITSFFVEMFFSFLLAPIRMVYYSYYFATSMIGSRLEWKTSYRFAEQLRLIDGWRLCWFPTLFALVWTAYLLHFDRTLFWWVSLVSIPLIISMPTALAVSNGSFGRWWARMGLLKIPAEVSPSAEIRGYEAHTEKQEHVSAGFLSVVTDSEAHQFHLSLLRGPRTVTPRIEARRNQLAQRVLNEGAKALTPKEKKELLFDPHQLAELYKTLGVDSGS